MNIVYTYTYMVTIPMCLLVCTNFEFTVIHAYTYGCIIHILTMYIKFIYFILSKIINKIFQVDIKRLYLFIYSFVYTAIL